MGLLDKLKNVFFEEEYVEEEVKVKKDQNPIAKKIDLPENNSVSKSEDDEEVESVVVETNDEKEEIKRENSFKFPMNFEEEDFAQDTSASSVAREPEPIEEQEVEEEEDFHQRPYSSREEKREATTFKASPIISPIYGVLDKNYKKEEIVTKKEIRLSSSHQKFDVDSVREKAYGDLASEITASILDDDEEKEIVDVVYDLNEENSPAVASVTVGDAEEYFDDLGLEYNIDYEDTSTKVSTGRRSTRKKAVVEVAADDVDTAAEQEEVIEDNLFDLIDSMYEDKE